jgi:peptidylprolyl isomerase
MIRTAKPAVLAVLAALALVAPGCGGDNETKSGSVQPGSEQAQPPRPKGALAKKPKVPKPKGPAPNKVVIKDLIKGKGRKAESGNEVSVNYLAVIYKTGKEFDDSWDGSQPIDFPLGAGMVIPGWDEGIPGMRVGGRRELLVPANKGYGAEGSPPDIRRTRRSFSCWTC